MYRYIQIYCSKEMSSQNAKRNMCINQSTWLGNWQYYKICQEKFFREDLEKVLSIWDIKIK